MQTLDWVVMAIYLSGMLWLALHIGRSQRGAKDYFLGGQQMSSGSLAASTIATQCSTNSLLGAPAFVGFAAGGGLVWLQYELAVPLAMIALTWLLVPARQMGVTSIYEVLERNLGLSTRKIASACFLVFRGVATGVTIYGVALVIGLLLEVSFGSAVLLLMGITILYDLLGGLRAVVVSDVIQLILLSLTVVVSLIFLASDISWTAATDISGISSRTQVLVNDWGLDGNNYGFWPMLIGGLFLYTAYYGCDQSQAQRVLAAKSPKATQRVLLYNGLLRFPLVLAYCFLGLGLAAYASQNTDFITSLPVDGTGKPNYNLAFPMYVLGNFAPGVVGLVMVGLVAAAMSSIDSAINSLSAATMEDFINPALNLTTDQQLLGSRITTACWGIFALAFSFHVESIAPTVLEAINKVGSLANGPLLALFSIALLIRGIPQWAALSGFGIALIANVTLAITAPNVSWLWWNVHGFIWAMGIALICASAGKHKLSLTVINFPPRGPTLVALSLMALLIFVVCLWLPTLLDPAIAAKTL